jgi:hypothetical protein
VIKGSVSLSPKMSVMISSVLGGGKWSPTYFGHIYPRISIIMCGIHWRFGESHSNFILKRTIPSASVRDHTYTHLPCHLFLTLQ